MIYQGKKTDMEIPLPGMFNVYNALAAAAAALASVKGITINDIQSGIKNFMPQTRRMQVITLSDQTVLVNDSYNANPTSMLNSIENFSKIFYNKRKILVLGDMLELGSRDESEHRKIGNSIAKNQFADIVLTIGPLAKNIAEETNGKWFKDKTSLYKYLKEKMLPGDAVLFKASRMIALDEIVGKLNPERN